MTAVGVRAVLAGREVTRGQILAWESRRLPRAARRIGLPTPGGDLPTARHAFAAAKLDLGRDEIHRRLARQLRASDAVGHATATLSRGRRVSSVCDLFVTGGSAAEFVSWFSAVDRPDHRHSMIAANPDHFWIATADDGRQEVVETTGGSALPAGFVVDYEDVGSLVTPRDPGFPLDLSGVARAGDGAAIGGVRHQFRDERDGFHARLTVEFPQVFAPWMVSGHRWHLAAEFANWVEFAFV